MKCPACEKDGRVSRVTLGEGLDTRNPAEAYYDEDGHYHFHQHVGTVYRWSCSNGHVGTASVTKPCDSAGISPKHAPSPCGFRGETLINVTS